MKLSIIKSIFDQTGTKFESDQSNDSVGISAQYFPNMASKKNKIPRSLAL